MDESSGFIPCNICELEKEYHDDIFQTYEIAICDDYNIPEIFNDTCYECDKIFPEEEIDFLVFAFKKVVKCVQCFAKNNDIELEKTFLNYRYNKIEIHMIENLYINKYINELKIKSEKDDNIFYSNCSEPNINLENITSENESLTKNKKFNNVDKNDCLGCGLFKSNCICKKLNINNNIFNEYKEDNPTRINKIHEDIRNISENKNYELNKKSLHFQEEINDLNIPKKEKDDKIKKYFGKFILGIKKRIIIKRIKNYLDKKHKTSTKYINQNIVSKLIKSINKYTNIDIFDNIYKNNRNTIDLFSDYYEKFIINKKDEYIKLIRQLYDNNMEDSCG